MPCRRRDVGAGPRVRQLGRAFDARRARLGRRPVTDFVAPVLKEPNDAPAWRARVETKRSSRGRGSQALCGTPCAPQRSGLELVEAVAPRLLEILRSRSCPARHFGERYIRGRISKLADKCHARRRRSCRGHPGRGGKAADGPARPPPLIDRAFWRWACAWPFLQLRTALAVRAA